MHHWVLFNVCLNVLGVVERLMMKNVIIYSEGNIVERVMIRFQTIQNTSSWPVSCHDMVILNVEDINTRSKNN